MKNARLSMYSTSHATETSRRGRRPFLSKFTTYDNEDSASECQTDEKNALLLSDSMSLQAHPEDIVASIPTTCCATAVPTPTSNMRRNAGVENMIISQPTPISASSRCRASL
jgi:hypothetical protein